MKLRTKNGELSAYAFACGYIERIGDFKLYREHGIYHINGVLRGLDGIAVDNEIRWKSTKSLSEARKILYKMAKK